ncbi:MAG: hypothetical protein IK047_03440, partial [Clostridia bacterium]|nr:hypothetical protein [Clostridia bacterium]
MRKFTKLVSFILVLAIASAFCSCETPGGTSQPQESSEPPAVSEPEQSEEESSRPALPLAVIEAPEVIRVL